jgi:hypothetical protein
LFIDNKYQEQERLYLQIVARNLIIFPNILRVKNGAKADLDNRTQGTIKASVIASYMAKFVLAIDVPKNSLGISA